MSPELLTAYRLVVEIIKTPELQSGDIIGSSKDRIDEFLFLLGKEYEIEKKTVERWAAQAAGIITK